MNMSQMLQLCETEHTLKSDYSGTQLELRSALYVINCLKSYIASHTGKIGTVEVLDEFINRRSVLERPT